MIEVYVTFDTSNETWNVMNMDNVCLSYGSVWEIEEWIDEHINTHVETW